MTQRGASYPRREFLARAGAFAAAALVASERSALAASDPSTRSDPVAERAVQGAREFKGAKLSFSPAYGDERPDEEESYAAQWTELTGVEVQLDPEPKDVFEVLGPPFGSVPDLADGGAIIPLDGLIAKHGARAGLRDVHPVHRSLAAHDGKTWGLVDDGNPWFLCYRKDVFSDADLRSSYEARFGRDLRVPRAWVEFAETAQFITDERAPGLYGTGMGRELLPGWGSNLYFQFHFLVNGGRFFDRETMRATVNGPAGVKAVRQILAENAASVPGIEKLDFNDTIALWLQGRTAMVMLFGELGRFAENAYRRGFVYRFLPSSTIAGKVGYAIVRRTAYDSGGNVQCIGAGSKHKEAAYLFAQWLTSPSVSLARLDVPITNRTPWRISHYRAEELQDDWPTADEYARTLCRSANVSVRPLLMTGAPDYLLSLHNGLRAIYRGKGVQQGLDDIAAQWDAITKKRGVAKQRRSYLSYLKQTGSSREMTAAARGLAVTC